MKAKILFILAFVSHPIFLPLIINLPGWEMMRLLTAIGIALIIPMVLFSLKGIELVTPSLVERQLIYYFLAVAYFLLFLWSYLDGAIPISFGFAHWVIALLVLGLVVRLTQWNISWHAMGWGLASLFIKDEIEVLNYVLGIQPLGNWELALAMSIALGCLVMWIRYLQKAHSIKELALGYVLGLTVSIFVPTLFQWTSIA